MAAAGLRQAPPAFAAAEHDTAGIGAAEALELLKNGNQEFLSEQPYHGMTDRRRRLEIARTQTPFVVLVGCSDSRVSPELLFGRGLGELFIVRVTGNTVDQAPLGSIEYAVEHLGVPLIVVLGHECCGAVQAAGSVVEANATFQARSATWLRRSSPPCSRPSHSLAICRTLRSARTVKRVVARLAASGPLVGDPLASDRLKIVGGRYDPDDGKVELFDA